MSRQVARGLLTYLHFVFLTYNLLTDFYLLTRGAPTGCNLRQQSSRATAVAVLPPRRPVAMTGNRLPFGAAMSGCGTACWQCSSRGATLQQGSSRSSTRASRGWPLPCASSSTTLNRRRLHCHPRRSPAFRSGQPSSCAECRNLGVLTGTPSSNCRVPSTLCLPSYGGYRDIHQHDLVRWGGIRKTHGG